MKHNVFWVCFQIKINKIKLWDLWDIFCNRLKKLLNIMQGDKVSNTDNLNRLKNEIL